MSGMLCLYYELSNSLNPMFIVSSQKVSNMCDINTANNDVLQLSKLVMFGAIVQFLCRFLFIIIRSRYVFYPNINLSNYNFDILCGRLLKWWIIYIILDI